MPEHTETGIISSESLPKLNKRSLWIGNHGVFLKKEIKSKCPMCKRPLTGRYVFRCNHCNIVFATGKIIKQKQSKLCIYGVDCTLEGFFSKKSRHGIFCKEFKWFVNPEFCKRVCYYWTPKNYKSRPYKIYA